MYQTNLVWPNSGYVNFRTDFSRAMGGCLGITVNHLASPGNGVKITYCTVHWQWINPSSGAVFYESDHQGCAVNSAVLASPFWLNVLSPLEPSQNARLKVFAAISIQSADGSQSSLVYAEALTGTYSCVAPEQITAFTPENAPISHVAMAYCGLDAHGSNTRYEAEFARPSGSPSISMGQQISHYFVTGDISNLRDASGNIKWRARAVNDQGTGPWSNWCTFQCKEPITGSVICSVSPMPSKPIHGINGSFSCSSGHTITSYAWTLKKLVGGSWQTIGTGSSSTYAQTNSDNPSGIQYKLELLVYGTKNGISNNASFIGYCSYNGDV
jgi:hypothetical protein